MFESRYSPQHWRNTLQGWARIRTEMEIGKLSPTAVPAKAGTHFSVSQNFQAKTMIYSSYPSSARTAEQWTPAFAGVTRKEVVMGLLPSRKAHPAAFRQPFT